jgi:hypothetical protein
MKGGIVKINDGGFGFAQPPGEHKTGIAHPPEES